MQPIALCSFLNAEGLTRRSTHTHTHKKKALGRKRSELHAPFLMLLCTWPDLRELPANSAETRELNSATAAGRTKYSCSRVAPQKVVHCHNLKSCRWVASCPRQKAPGRGGPVPRRPPPAAKAIVERPLSLSGAPCFREKRIALCPLTSKQCRRCAGACSSLFAAPADRPCAPRPDNSAEEARKVRTAAAATQRKQSTTDKERGLFQISARHSVFLSRHVLLP